MYLFLYSPDFDPKLCNLPLCVLFFIYHKHVHLTCRWDNNYINITIIFNYRTNYNTNDPATSRRHQPLVILAWLSQTHELRIKINATYYSSRDLQVAIGINITLFDRKSSFRAPSRFPAFQLNVALFCIFSIYCAMYIFLLFCVFCLFGI